MPATTLSSEDRFSAATVDGDTQSVSPRGQPVWDSGLLNTWKDHGVLHCGGESTNFISESAEYIQLPGKPLGTPGEVAGHSASLSLLLCLALCFAS